MLVFMVLDNLVKYGILLCILVILVIYDLSNMLLSFCDEHLRCGVVQAGSCYVILFRVSRAYLFI